MYKKLGIQKPIEEDKIMVDTMLQLMEEHKADYTNTFAALTLNKASNDSIFISTKFNEWRKQWEIRTNQADSRIKAIKLMQTQNPLVIPRNNLVESALENAIEGDMSQFNKLLNLISKPYDYQSKHKNFQYIPEGFDDRYKTFCGT
tara:strand:- start:45 stop:482 length:438 start_codon:yes stop_codon:yes gene_type:complete